MRVKPHVEQRIITGIINSFKTYGLGDIKHNRKRPISCFILAICFIDQLASFCYPLEMESQSERSEKFITEYISIYANIQLYEIFRNAIIHHYSGKRKFALTNDKGYTIPHEFKKGKRIINTTILIKEIIKGFKKFEEKLLTVGSDERKNALARFKKHPPLMHTVV